MYEFKRLTGDILLVFALSTNDFEFSLRDVNDVTCGFFKGRRKGYYKP